MSDPVHFPQALLSPGRFLLKAAHFFRGALRFPTGPLFSEPIEEDVDRYPDYRENEDYREELGHANQGGVISQAVTEAFRPPDHFPAQEGQKTEDRADHQADNDHWHRHRDANFGEDLKRVRSKRTRKRNFGEIDASETSRGIDHDHWAARERDRYYARLAAETEAQDEQRHQCEHGRRDEKQDVWGDNLLDERKLCDDRRHHETDRAADRKADEQFVKCD